MYELLIISTHQWREGKYKYNRSQFGQERQISTAKVVTFYKGLFFFRIGWFAVQQPSQNYYSHVEPSHTSPGQV